ncbi:Tudor domain family protein [Brugia pahangi]
MSIAKMVHPQIRTFYVRKLRNRKGKLLYTSDESLADEISYDEARCSLITSNNGDEDVIVVENKTSVTANLLEKKIALDMNEPVTSFIRLRKRAPIYQIQHDDLLDVLEEQLDSLQPTSLISEEELQVGTLCVSFCRTFDSLFRAVITNINNIGIEVHYVDYGNYETVNRDDQMSIFNLSDVARTYPGMAIPCMLFNSLVSSTVSNSAETEDEFITNLKDAVSCEHHSFRIRILQIREDRICIVEYISSFAGPSSGSGIPESSYNLHGGVETITSTSYYGKQSTSFGSVCKVKKYNFFSNISNPVAVPPQYPFGHENRNREYAGRIQNQYDKFGYKQLNGNKLKIKGPILICKWANVHRKTVPTWLRNTNVMSIAKMVHPQIRTFYVRKLRNRKGKLLYTSDESLADEISYDEARCSLITSNNGDEDVIVVENKTSVTANLLEKKIALDMNEPVTSFIRLRKRAPIYQIQHDDLLDVLEEQLDSLQPTSLISEEELQVGTLCVSFCRTFDSLFRAVITNINNIGIEVHYVDYGNYETVNRDDQMSIFNLSDVARTYPGMAIPCMLFNSLVSSTVSNSAETEDEFITNLKDAVSCEHHSFRIRILQIREDRICIVEYISS